MPSADRQWRRRCGAARPLILLAYVVAYIDRVNVSFASLQMNDDLKFSATIYGLGGGLFFLGYALFEVPSSLMLARFRAPQWIARIMITWGLLAAGMMFVHTPLQFYVMRFLLGVAEAGFFPSVIFYFAGWFPMACRGRAVSRIYVASSLASIVMGGISGRLLGLDGMAGLRGWQWLFLVQGLPAVLLGLILLRFLPDAPATVHWLADREKAWIHRELARDAALIGAPVRHNLLAAFANPRVLLLGAIGLLGNGAGNGLLLSAPAVLIAGTGLDTLQVGSLVSIGGGLGVVCIFIAGWNSDRSGDRLRDAFRVDGRSCGCSPASWRCLDAGSGGRRVSAVLRDRFHWWDAPRVVVGRLAPRPSARRRGCCDQYAMADWRLSLALCLGCDEGRDGQLPGRADWCVGRGGG